MASGDPVVEVIAAMPPAANFAAIGARAGGSTPAENYLGYLFDAAVNEHVDFLCRLSGYAGGGLTFTLPWLAVSATTGVVRWGIAIRRLDTAEDVDVAHTYDFNEVDSSAPATNGQTVYPTITFTDGVDMDNWANGELAIVRVRRNAAGSTMTGDAFLWLDALRGVET